MSALRPSLSQLLVPLLFWAASLPANLPPATVPAPPPFSRYEVILARMPFGVPPPVAPRPAQPDPAAVQQSQAEQRLAKQISMVAVNVTPGGKTAVGFIDNAEKPPRNYYLAVGESANGFRVEKASYGDETATLSKDGVAIDLKLGVGVVAKSAVAAAAQPVPRPGASRLPAPWPASRRVAPLAMPRSRGATAGAPTSLAASMPLPGTVKAVERALSIVKEPSYVERLKKRREELLASSRRQEQEQRSKLSEAADERAAQLFTMLLRRRNMEMIRRGEGSLGIELTPEEDAQLVREKVLPPGN